MPGRRRGHGGRLRLVGKQHVGADDAGVTGQLGNGRRERRLRHRLAGQQSLVPPSGVPGLAACNTSALSVSLASNQGGGAAGSTYLPINFTNTSGAACSLYGFPGVSFVTGRGGSQIGAAATRAPNVSSVSVSVDPHATAHAWLQVVQAGNYPASSCHPVTAHWLKVYPPGNTAASYIGHTFPACSGTVTVLTVMPVRPGAGVQGQVP